MPGLILNVTNYCRFGRKGRHTVRKGIGVNVQDRRKETVKDHESDTLKQDSVEQLTIGMFDSFKKRKNQGKATKSVSTTRSNGELSTTSWDLCEESETFESRSQGTSDRGQSKKGKTKQLSKKKVLDNGGEPLQISKKLKKKKSRGRIDDSSQGNSEDDQYVKHNKENQDKRKTLKRGQSNRSDRSELRKSKKKWSSERKIEKSEERSQEDSEDEQCLTRKNNSDTRKALHRQKSNRSDSDELRKSKKKWNSQSRFEMSEESSYDDSEIERFAARFLKEAGTRKVEQREKSNHSRSSVQDLKKKRRSIENWYEQEKRNSKASQCVISKKGKKKKPAQQIPTSITVISDQVETSLGLARTMVSDFECKKSPLSTPSADRLDIAKIEDITGLIDVLEEDQMAMNCRIREIQEEASRLRLEKDEAHRHIKSLEESKLQDEFRLQKLGPNVGILQEETTSSTAKQALETSEVSDSVATTSQDEDKVTLVIANLIEAKTELQSQLLAAEEDKSNLRSELEQTKKTLCDLESDTAEDRERLRRHHISGIKSEFQLRTVDEHDVLKRSNQDLEAHQTLERAESPRSTHCRKTEESNEHTVGTPMSFFPATWGYLSSPSPHEDDDNSEGTFWELISIGGGSSRRDKVATYF